MCRERNHRGQRARWPPVSRRCGSNQHLPGEWLCSQGTSRKDPSSPCLPWGALRGALRGAALLYSFRDAQAAVVAVAHVAQWGQEQVQVVLSLPLSVLRLWHRGAAPRMAWPWCPLWQHLLWVMRRSCAVPWIGSVITPQPAVLGEEKGSGLF